MNARAVPRPGNSIQAAYRITCTRATTCAEPERSSSSYAPVLNFPALHRLLYFIEMLTQLPISLLDVVALTVPLPQNNLLAGQVGTVVELLGRDTYEVEFSDDNGKTYAQLPLKRDQILPLHFHPEHRTESGRFN